MSIDVFEHRRRAMKVLLIVVVVLFLSPSPAIPEERQPRFGAVVYIHQKAYGGTDGLYFAWNFSSAKKAIDRAKRECRKGSYDSHKCSQHPAPSQVIVYSTSIVKDHAYSKIDGIPVLLLKNRCAFSKTWTGYSRSGDELLVRELHVKNSKEEMIKELKESYESTDFEIVACNSW